MSTQSQALRQAMAKATTGAELNELATELAAADRAAAVRKQAEADLDWASTAVNATFTPVQTYTVHTAASDWLGDVPEGTADWSRRLVAEASLWYTRLAPEVIEDTDEFNAQARGAARIAAGRLGVHPAATTPSFLDYVHFLRKRAGSGLPQIQQITDANNAPAQTPLPPDVFDNFAPPVDPVNAGTAGTETSMRAPIMQELGGTAPAAGPGSAPAPSAPGAPGGAPVSGPDPVRSGDEAEGVDTEDDQDKGPLSRSMAVNHSYTLGDYLHATAAMPETSYDEDYDFFGPEEYDRHRDDRQRAAEEFPATEEASRKWHQHHRDFGHEYQMLRHYDDAMEYGPDYANHAHPLPYGTHTGASTLDQIQQTTAPDGVTNRPTPMPEAVAYPWIISPNAENDAPPADGEMAQGMTGATTGEAAYGHQATRVTADQWHGQEWPHAVVQPDAFNTPASTPTPPTGSAASGRADALADRGAIDTAPTYNDVSGHIPDYARSYAETYSTAPAAQPNQDVPPGMDGPPTYPAHLSQLLSTAAERAIPDYAAGYAAGSTWKTADLIPAFGNSDAYEAGLYAGILDNPTAQRAFTDAHRHAAVELDVHAAGNRIARHASASAALHGHPALPDDVGIEGAYLAWRTAATSTDLDTMAPDTSADPTGNTPFNGPGRPPMLDGQYGAADPGGPPPYNGAPPYGTPAVPTGAAATTGAPVTVPDTGMTTPNRATAFRRTVQANLVRAAAGAPLLTITDPQGSL